MNSNKVNKDRLNLLLRYRSIMQEFEKYHKHYIPISSTYRRYIYPKFHISRDTLYRIFNTDIESEIKAIEQQKRHELEKAGNTPTE